MTTRWKQKASWAAIVAFFGLLLFIILLWSTLRQHGVMTTNSTNINIKDKIINYNNNDQNINLNRYNKFNVKFSNESDEEFIKKMIEEENKIYSEIEPINNFNEDNNINYKNQNLSTTLSRNSTVEYISLSKIHHNPLNKDDLLYESERNKSITDDYYQGYKTGNFRNRSSKIWDPHPEYIIDAFGQKIHLMLYQDTSFVPPDFKVTHVYENQTNRIPEKEEDRYHLECYYKGRVKDDEKSVVAVSLCNGMTGHIRTSFGSFFIEPIEEYTKTDTELIHKIWREIGHHHIYNDIEKNNGKHSHCPIAEEHNHSDDERTIDFVGNSNGKDEVIEETNNNHNYNNHHQHHRNHHHHNQNQNDDQYYDHQQHQPQQHFPLNQKDNPIAENIIRRRRKRNTFENQYTLEVLVAVDRATIDFHGEHKIKNYVLTLMGVVSSIFSDASIGNAINVVVSEILLIKDDIEIQKYRGHGVSAPYYLKRFCSYIDKRNFHYDTAVLITRHTICRNDTEMICNTLGLAELGTACKKNSCSVVVDNGLNAAFTIAHELGHIFSAPHDDDKKKCHKYNIGIPPQMNIMSSTMAAHIHPWTWSDCSRGFIDEFLEKEDVSCMKTSARNEIVASNKRLPGEKYSLDEQCKLTLGPHASLCTSITQDCRQQFCTEYDENTCKSNGPWADGTPCDGRNVNHFSKSHYWCQKGECVSKNSKQVPRDGGWSSWSEWSECSRSCGGGVQESHRECNNPIPKNGGKYCIGSKRQYRSCNTMECPETDMDFREKQCADFNHNNFEIRGLPKNVRWIAKYGVAKRDECKLYCRAEGEPNYFQLADKVIDGTTCSYESFDKCVNGVCQPAACDNVLNSSAKLDRCGVCNGKNDTCTEVVRKFYRYQLLSNQRSHNGSTFYYYVDVIPRGASNIEIIEGSPGKLTYIVLLDDNQKFLLNGNNVISIYKFNFPYGGVNFEYSGANNQTERVNTTYSRKLKRDLVINLIVMPNENGSTNELLLTYSYTIARPYITSIDDDYDDYNHHQIHHENQYNQHHYDSHRNHQQRHQNENEDDNNNINNNYPNIRPHAYPHAQKVEIYKWETDQWTPCDSICEGQRKRSFVCVQVNAGLKVASTNCDPNSKPSNTELTSSCNDHCTLMANVTSVSECSATCGQIGNREKYYTCIQKFHNGSSVIQDLSYCHQLPMQKYEKCSEACWSYTEWSECSRSCGTGQRTRQVICISNGIQVDESQCNPVKRQHYHELSQICNTEQCPEWIRDEAPHQANSDEELPAKWEVGEWSECNNMCERNRSVYCNASYPRNCPMKDKPVNRKRCCNIKYVSKLSACSADCGNGFRTKEFYCAKVFKLDEKTKKREKIPIDESYCKRLKLNKPNSRGFTKPCKVGCHWKALGDWTECTPDCREEYSRQTVHCVNKDKRLIPNENCDRRNKPETRKLCTKCNKIRTEVKYSNCLCEGYKRKRIVCFDSRNKHVQCPDKYHSISKVPCIPPPRCNAQPRSCAEVKRLKHTTKDGEYNISIKNRTVKIYCHNMAGHRPTEYITVDSVENYSVYYDKRARNLNSCNNNENEEFTDSNISFGSTMFEKVRLNLNHPNRLQIITDDYKFARIQSNAQPLGTAGDCYNKNLKCPKGHFSINLSNTGFRISDSVKWESDGYYVKMQLRDKLLPPYQVVRGLCGGYCGTCSISKSTGLIVDVV
ncbi:A disintegrin and metalloproteinase with thrombospondin motifs 9-like isoform X3 [Condylostylus longicornis]|uniref:A disintegrin and metalloproteinase with thrombospondin motifs 9-like isoform X3 n=1 Tax=Condylostylus longicornis TaxID=2530218 RepID=UPI00244E3F65|nr:A disintegrin and metalloproteinase with thrombospondin motifs 9-like isoform X3 [Condylostylus longicornis]